MVERDHCDFVTITLKDDALKPITLLKCTVTSFGVQNLPKLLIFRVNECLERDIDGASLSDIKEEQSIDLNFVEENDFSLNECIYLDESYDYQGETVVEVFLSLPGNEVEDSSAPFIEFLKFKKKRRRRQWKKSCLNRVFPCPYENCQKAMKSKAALVYHMEIHRNKSYSCSLCSKTFRHKTILRNHMALHLEKVYKCNDCVRSFTMQSALKRHIREEHNRVLTYVCPECGKKFVRYREFRVHKISHSDVKPFQCSLCLLQFNRKQHLESHSRQHVVSDEINYMYHCLECPSLVMFRSYRSLALHCKNVHPHYKRPSKSQCLLHLQKNLHVNLHNEGCQQYLESMSDDVVKSIL